MRFSNPTSFELCWVRVLLVPCPQYLLFMLGEAVPSPNPAEPSVVCAFILKYNEN